MNDPGETPTPPVDISNAFATMMSNMADGLTPILEATVGYQGDRGRVRPRGG